MMLRWLLAFAVVLALVFCGSALAGPKAPWWGDPDIYEGTKPKGLNPREQISGNAGLHLIVIDVPVYQGFIQVRHERKQRLDPVPRRNSAVSRRSSIGPQ